MEFTVNLTVPLALVTACVFGLIAFVAGLRCRRPIIQMQAINLAGCSAIICAIALAVLFLIGVFADPRLYMLDLEVCLAALFVFGPIASFGAGALISGQHSSEGRWIVTHGAQSSSDR